MDTTPFLHATPGAAPWAETVLLVDADHLDRVAFDLIVNFERMLERRIPTGDLCRWLDCAALDGGLRPGDNEVQAIFLHSAAKTGLSHLAPGRFADELDGKAFRDNLGEFALLSFPVEEVVTPEAFFTQALAALADAAEVKRLVVVADMDRCGADVRRIAAKTDGKDITLLTMEPAAGSGFRQELLGYSLMSALGISSDELR